MKAAVIRNYSQHSEQNNSEILELTQTASYDVVLTLEVNLDTPHPRHYIPRQKLEELKELVIEYDIDRIIVSDQLKPNQTFTLEEELDIDVIDKPMLILEIFENKSNSRDIKMQVQLAQLKYSVPRMVTQVGEAVRSERPGYGGSGEQVTDIVIADLQRRIKNLKNKIENYKNKTKDKYQSKTPRLPIVGHYSSGKTTLFNILTENEREIGEEAFTTMVMKTSRSTISGYPIDFIDTVGLVDLPADILSAFDLMLTSIFSFSGMILCLDTSLEFDQWVDQINGFQDYVNQFTKDIPRILIALTKTDLVSPSELSQMEKHLHSLNWLNKFEIIHSRFDQQKRVHEQFIESFEILYQDKLTEFYYQHLDPGVASRIHDISRIKDQQWHEDGTTSLSGKAPNSLLNPIKGELFQ